MSKEEKKDTKILCPDCFKGTIETENGKKGTCKLCGTKFEITSTNSVRYK